MRPKSHKQFKEEIAEENELDYYSRHNFPINEEKNGNGENN